jgi:hypothetical protein
VSVQTTSPASVHVELTRAERDRFVRWWIEQSGLTPRQLRAIATGLFADRIGADETGDAARAA